MRKNPRGVFEKVTGTNVWRMRYWETERGKLRRERIGTKAAAIKTYRKRRTQIMERVKLPENFRAKPVEMKELIHEALQYSEKNNRGHKQDRLRLLHIGKEFGSRIAES